MTLIHFHSTFIFTSSKIQIILSQCKQFFHKSWEHSKFWAPEMWCGANFIWPPKTVKRLVATATWRPEFVHPCVILTSPSSSSKCPFFKRFYCQKFCELSSCLTNFTALKTPSDRHKSHSSSSCDEINFSFNNLGVPGSKNFWASRS